MPACRYLAGVVALALQIANVAAAQTPAARIARWYDNARAAYAMILDDYGGAYFGEFAVIDSTLRNRGLAVSFAAVANWATATDWRRARSTFDYCEFVNHAWDHSADEGRDYALQFDSSQALIDRGVPGRACRFFAFPGPMITTPERVAYLRAHRYIGCRTNAEGEQVNGSSFDPFRVTTTFYRAAEGPTRPNEYVDAAIAAGGFALRSFHCVSDDPSRGWEPVATAIWRAHLDYVAARVREGALWCAPVQAVITYAVARDGWGVAARLVNDESIEVVFDTQARLNPSPLIDNSVYDQPLTVLVTLPAGFAAQRASQKGVPLAFTRVDATTIRVNAAPLAGPVLIEATSMRADRRGSIVTRFDAAAGDRSRFLLSGARLGQGVRASGPGVRIETDGTRPAQPRMKR